MTASRAVALATLLLYGVFWVWYGGRGEPLDLAEANARIDAIEAQGRAADGDAFDPEVVNALRELVKHDDGNEFYMLNLIRFREKAKYPDGPEFAQYGDDALAADARYNELVVPALFRRGSHPFLLGNYAGRFLPPEAGATERWDRVAIVRYRSRADMLDMAEELQKVGGGHHKFAAIDETIVFPVEPTFDLVFTRSAVAVVFAIVGGGLALALRRRPA